MVNSLTELVAAGAINNTQPTQNTQLSNLLASAASSAPVSRALDDIASIAAANTPDSQTSSLRSAALNVSQASGFLEVAQEGVNQISERLERLAELARQAQESNLSADARAALNEEFQAAAAEIEQTATQTSFNNVSLLDGSLSDNAVASFAGNLSAGDVQAQGSVGDDILVNTPVQTRISFVSATQISAGDTITLSDEAGNATSFTFVNNTPAAATEIQVGVDLDELLENTSQIIREFRIDNSASFTQVNASVQGNALVLETVQAGNATLNVVTTTAGSVSTANGVNASNVTSNAFAGQVSGFQAEFVAENTVNLSLQVGDDVFAATNVNTNPAQNQTVSLESATGGSLELTFAAGQGQAVLEGEHIEALQQRLDAALSSIRFAQERQVTNFDDSGAFANASLSLTASAFEEVAFEEAAISNNRLEITANDQRFVSAELGGFIAPGQGIELFAENGDQIRFNNGDTGVDIANEPNRNAFVQAFESSVPPIDGGAATFRVSSSQQGEVQLAIGNFTNAGLNLEGLDLLSLESATVAFGAVGAAIDTVASQSNDVGSFRNALDIAASNIEIALQNQDASRSVLLDSDSLAGASDLSLLEAAQQASTDPQTQTNRLQSNLLQLIQ